MIVYIIFLVLIIIVNGIILCKKCFHILATSKMIQTDDEMHIGEYSHIGMDGLENQKPIGENPFDKLDKEDKEKGGNENPFAKSPYADKDK